MTLKSALIAVTFLSLHLKALDIPVSFDPNITIELVAQEPEIVTPTGVAVDARGRIWAIENNTHFRPKVYKGADSDRIQIFDNFDSTGRAKSVTTFADGFRDSMNLLLDNGGAIFATRNEIMFLKDDGTGKAGERKTLIKLETKGNYPHNGLAGLAIGPDGLLYFGLGENLGEAYTIHGSDGSTYSGGGEGGSIFRCEKDGAKLAFFATGFWNPWGLKFDDTGRLFAVDNDPDSRPPCRLLHVVPGGDYGYRFRYGRKGTHPFDAWNGEIPGTLPMVSGTGEAPCAIYACSEKFWPRENIGDLLVTSWGDHVIQRFHLNPVGASFQAQPEAVIQGGLDFRPVGLVPAPDGSLIVTDWVSSSYPVHGKGRIWRLKVKNNIPPVSYIMELDVQSVRQMADVASPATQAKLKNTALTVANLEARVEALARITDKSAAESLTSLLGHADPFVFSAAIGALGRVGNVELLSKASQAADARTRLGALLAMRKFADPAGRAVLATLLMDPDDAVRRASLQWAGEERIKEVLHQVDKSAALPMTRDLFDAFLAAKSLLSGDKPDKGEYIESQMANIFPSDKNPLSLRILALKFLRVDHPGMSVAKLKLALESTEPALRAEALRALAIHPSPDAQPLLREKATDKELPLDLRASVIAGLTRSANTDETRTLLISFLNAEAPPVLQREALRALRASPTDPKTQAAVKQFATLLPKLPAAEQPELAAQIAMLATAGGFEKSDEVQPIANLRTPRPANETEWVALTQRKDLPASISAGRRLFYHARGPNCFLCHRINGRGGAIGPDLTTIGKTTDHKRIVESILEPSRDVAPQFVQWLLNMKDGRHLTGVIVEENNATILLGDATGVVTKLKNTDVERRGIVKGSLMPDKLIDLLTPQEFRDLLAFLQAPDGND